MDIGKLFREALSRIPKLAMLIRSLVFAVLLLLAHSQLASALQDKECSGHGHLDEQGLCVCDTPWPESGSKGWIGEQCQVPVFAGSDDGSDMAAQCAQTDFCADLKEDEWVCFAVPAPAAADTPPSWNYLALLLNKTAGEGDVDLYGYLKNASKVLSFKSASGFAFQDTSTSRNAPVRHSVARTDFPGKNQLYFAIC